MPSAAQSQFYPPSRTWARKRSWRRCSPTWRCPRGGRVIGGGSMWPRRLGGAPCLSRDTLPGIVFRSVPMQIRENIQLLVGRRFCRIIAAPFVVIAWRAPTRAPRAALTVVAAISQHLFAYHDRTCASSNCSAATAPTPAEQNWRCVIFDLWEWYRSESWAIPRSSGEPFGSSSRPLGVTLHDLRRIVLSVSRRFHGDINSRYWGCAPNLPIPRHLRSQFRDFWILWITRVKGELEKGLASYPKLLEIALPVWIRFL